MTTILSDVHRNAILKQARSKDNEIEVRFGKFREAQRDGRTGKMRDRSFQSDVGRSHVFRAVLKYMKTMGNVEVNKLEDERWRDGTRKRYNKTTNVTEWVRKTKDVPIDVYAYNIRVGIATEMPTVNILYEPDDGVRRITRYSVQVGEFIYDLSRVQAKYSNRNDVVTTFEFEIEITKGTLLNSSLFDELDMHIQNAFKVVHGTDLLYTTREVENVNEHVNFLLGQGVIPLEYPDTEFNHPRKNFLFRQYFNDARNLRRPDMVDGGLVGNVDQTYKVTDKADGLRRFLHFNVSGVWIVSTDSYNLIYRRNMAEWKDVLLEGEYIPANNPDTPDHQTRLTIGGKYMQPEHSRPHVMYLYDALSDVSILYALQNKDHSSRMLVCQKMVEIMNPIIPMLYLESKVFYQLAFETMYGLIHLCLTKELPYERDGLMFVPENAPYDVWRNYKYKQSQFNARRDEHTAPKPILPPLHTRVLTNPNNQDTCKWKPANMLTIDLQVKFVGNIVELWTERGRTPFKFLGSKRYPITWENGMNINDPHLMIDGIRVEDGTIMECIYSMAGKDYDVTLPFMVKAVKVRDDKVRPNQWDVCEDNWDLSHAPLPEHTISGKGSILMHAYHNDIKRELLSGLKEGSTLLDIGSGRGGDLGKWTKLSQVIAVEPIDVWLDEFRLRLANSPMINKVHIIHSGAENVDRIIKETRDHVVGGRVDAISFMLSLTFFWQSELMVRNIAYLIQETLKPGGKVIFLTMDGDAVEKHFTPGSLLPPDDKAPLNQNIDDDYIKFRRLEGGKYFIHLEDSNVLNQEEYAAHISDLVYLLDGNMTKMRADKRRILNNTEKILSNMYSYGEITLNEKQSPIPKPERAVNIMTFNPAKQAPASKRNVASPPSKNKGCTTSGCSGNQPNLCTLPPNLFLDAHGRAVVSASSDQPFRVMLDGNSPIEIIPFTPGLFVFRLDTIGDGTCFIHAALQGCSHRYAAKFRANRTLGQLVGSYIRADIAIYLTYTNSGTANPNDPQYPTYLLFNGGKFAIDFTEQMEAAQNACDARERNPAGPAESRVDSVTGNAFKDERVFKIDHNVDRSPTGIVNLFRATGSYLGEEAYNLFANLFGIDVYIYEVRMDRCIFRYTTATEGRLWHAVMIGMVSSVDNSYEANHYETLGVEDVNSKGEPVLITVFPHNSPLFSGIERRLASQNVGDDQSLSYFRKHAVPRMSESLKRLKDSGSSFSVFKCTRPFFADNVYDIIITGLMRRLGVGENVWPNQATAVQESSYPPSFYSQTKMLKLLGIDRPSIPPKTPIPLSTNMTGVPSIFTMSNQLGDIVLDPEFVPVQQGSKYVVLPFVQ